MDAAIPRVEGEVERLISETALKIAKYRVLGRNSRLNNIFRTKVLQLGIFVVSLYWNLL